MSGAGESGGRRAMRFGAWLCLTAAVVLFGLAAGIQLDQPPTKRPLPVGTRFSVSLTAEPTAPAVAAVALGPRLDEMAAPETATVEPPTPEPTAQPTPAPTPSPEPTPPPSEASVARLTIPRIKVDAPISYKGIGADGVMQDPNSWNDVAYYNFSGRPGFGTGNNAVFAGHVDYIRHGPAVFWDLDKLKPGDEVDIGLQDGTRYAYRVTQANVYPADDAPVAEILGDTPTESVTLITCNGVFSAGEYNNRLVVRAERVPPENTAGSQASTGG